jgi:hypothetical protein
MPIRLESNLALPLALFLHCWVGENLAVLGVSAVVLGGRGVGGGRQHCPPVEFEGLRQVRSHLLVRLRLCLAQLHVLLVGRKAPENRLLDVEDAPLPSGVILWGLWRGSCTRADVEEKMPQVHEEVFRLCVAHLGPARGAEPATDFAWWEEGWGFNVFIRCGASPRIAARLDVFLEPLNVNSPPGW